ncbi:hypothetical protein RRG08_016219 [Elysia crispata]|uniref:Uncharacterized protein n=1 Tax=Elysia crispata TaxID=231223 RepID=A0AAE1DJN8_9GAST|nr:hypothetical protein RRG08_016219 [Elysia crispata]
MIRDPEVSPEGKLVTFRFYAELSPDINTATERSVFGRHSELNVQSYGRLEAILPGSVADGVLCNQPIEWLRCPALGPWNGDSDVDSLQSSQSSQWNSSLVRPMRRRRRYSFERLSSAPKSHVDKANLVNKDVSVGGAFDWQAGARRFDSWLSCVGDRDDSNLHRPGSSDSRYCRLS